MNNDALGVLRQQIFSPRSVALIGASSDATKNTSRPQRYMRKYGYAGQLFPINPGRDEVFGEKAYPDVTAVPDDIDHAFIMVPANRVNKALEQCVAKKIPVVTIYTDGFAEVGTEGRAMQEELQKTAKAGGVRLIGPNCIGLFSSQTNLALSVNAVLEYSDIKPGPITVVSQSGSMTGGLLSRGLGRGLGFSKLVSVGNEADIGVGEFADMLVDDPHTGAILLFMETLRDADHLARAGRRAYAAGKPIIVFKLGRSEIGQDCAASHTGAMAGSDELADTFFKANGILRVDQLETLFELGPMIAGTKPSKRHRVAIMSTTGGGAATVADRLGTLGIDVVGPTQTVIDNLAKNHNIIISKARVTDLTLAGAKKEIYSAVLNELLASDHCDLVLPIAGSSAQFHPQIAVAPVVEADKRDKLIAVFLAPQAEKSLNLLSDAGIAGFRTPESCADAIRAWRDWTAPRTQPVIDTARVGEAKKLLGAANTKQLNEFDACRVFATLGVNQAATAVINSPDDTANVPFPVVAKILSPDIAHKTDAGGVVLNIADAAALKTAAREILDRVGKKHPQAKLNGILVQRMEKGLAEVILGFKRDPQVGPVVVLGIGGVLAEIYKDFAARLAPVSVADAAKMIEQVKGLAPIRGYRGMTKGDCAALAKTVSDFSQLAYIDSIVEAEINPLMVRREDEGVIAVDGLIVQR
ncbi:MAG TPA: acetate--CoA ligase family protein [Burkholderiales bacterium]|nr:acetate--CoA ligase family protein [Burkholderiales bacterium]